MRISKSGRSYGFKKGHTINNGRIATEETRKALRLAYTEERREQARKGKDYLLGNTHYKSFLRKLTPENQRLWKKENGRKISLWYKNNPEYVQKLRVRMWNNTYMTDYLIKHRVWREPNWNEHVPFKSVPEFVPIPQTQLNVIEQINYFTQGVTSGGLL